MGRWAGHQDAESLSFLTSQHRACQGTLANVQWPSDILFKHLHLCCRPLESEPLHEPGLSGSEQEEPSMQFYMSEHIITI